MRILLDTHIVVWLSTEPSRVPDHLQKLVLEADQRFISVVSFFEVALNHRKDPDSFPFTFEFLTGAMGDLQATELPLRRDHISHVGTIPVLHKDPFDHLLMAQAIEEKLVFVTMDTAIQNYRLDGLTVLN
jgi:PIN domain nuclease of toxin-antitoxin system